MLQGLKRRPAEKQAKKVPDVGTVCVFNRQVVRVNMYVDAHVILQHVDGNRSLVLANPDDFSDMPADFLQNNTVKDEFIAIATKRMSDPFEEGDTSFDLDWADWEALNKLATGTKLYIRKEDQPV